MSDDVEAVQACLRDDAATLRDDNKECEIASNMDAAATLIGRLTEELAAANEARDALRAEVERLAQAIGLATTCVPSMEIDPNDPIGMMQRVCAEVERLREAMSGINDIRNDIVGAQTMNWSAHVYPLVSHLNAAGFDGLPYPEARLAALNLREDAERWREARNDPAGFVHLLKLLVRDGDPKKLDAMMDRIIESRERRAAAIDAARKEA